MFNIDEIISKFVHREVKAKDIFEIIEIQKEVAYDFIRQYHYLGDAKFFSMYNYGLFFKGTTYLVGCATYSLPQGTCSTRGWFGLAPNDRSIVELSRLCMLPKLNGTNATSYLLGNSVKMLKQHDVRGVITLANSNRHNGAIYQVCNFKYYGKTKSAKDFYREDGLVNPRGETSKMHGVYLNRDIKHRYAYILDKKLECMYKEETRPPTNDITNTRCCDSKFIVYDPRYGEWYTCPKCTTKMIKLCEADRKYIESNNNSIESVESIISNVRHKEKETFNVGLFDF